jgi:N-acetylglucosaminyldiphosphoundecaprenol N-acetyl-beta-D-mannosaminyltransferase
MLVTARRNKILAKSLENAIIVATDGMPLVWYLRKKSFNDIERIPGTELTLALLESAQSARVSVYFYGSFPPVLEKLVLNVCERFPRLKIAGALSPSVVPKAGNLDQDAIKKINDSGAQIVFVGLGCPKQELWMNDHSPHISAVMLGIGAAFDFLAGNVPRCPVFLQNIGLEWLFRLCLEPRRLWKRYLHTNSSFLYLLAKDLYSNSVKNKRNI